MNYHELSSWYLVGLLYVQRLSSYHTYQLLFGCILKSNTHMDVIIPVLINCITHNRIYNWNSFSAHFIFYRTFSPVHQSQKLVKKNKYILYIHSTPTILVTRFIEQNEYIWTVKGLEVYHQFRKPFLCQFEWT